MSVFFSSCIFSFLFPLNERKKKKEILCNTTIYVLCIMRQSLEILLNKTIIEQNVNGSMV
jgi:hypothetical protein